MSRVKGTIYALYEMGNDFTYEEVADLLAVSEYLSDLCNEFTFRSECNDCDTPFLVRRIEPDHPEYALFDKKMREGREAVL